MTEECAQEVDFALPYMNVALGYVQPNLVVDSGEIDANYFQHVPYLDNFNEEKGTSLVSVAGIHYEPFGIYPGTKSDLSKLSDGDVIAVPNDTTNEARALLLLQDNGIITLADGAGLLATVKDIVKNPYNIKIQELEAAQVSRVKDEVAFVVLNGNYALEAGFSVAHDAVAYETSDSVAAKTYVNVLVVKEGNENKEGIQALAKVLKSEEIKHPFLDFADRGYAVDEAFGGEELWFHCDHCSAYAGHSTADRTNGGILLKGSKSRGD